MIIIGHRGADGYEPENTMRSFLRAIEQGADMVEFDVHISHDGVPVVIHDSSLKRTAGRKGKVEKLELCTLENCDVGSHEHIPTLEKVLGELSGKARLNIELKTVESASPAAKIVSHHLKNNSYSFDDIIVSSFHSEALVDFQRELPDVRLGLLKTFYPWFLSRSIKKITPYSVHLPRWFTSVGSVDAIHKKGIKVFVWTVNSEDDFRKLKNKNIDGIFTDYPDKAREWLFNAN